MILGTIRGRLETKLLTYLILGAVTLLFAAMYGAIYLAIFAIAMVVGLLLELLWGMVIKYQPGWLTFVFGGVEFFAILIVAFAFQMPMDLGAALRFYLTAWVVTQLFLIYVLPIWRLSWADDGLELW